MTLTTTLKHPPRHPHDILVVTSTVMGGVLVEKRCAREEVVYA